MLIHPDSCEKWSTKCNCTWCGFSLRLPNLAFGEVYELNGFVCVVTISLLDSQFLVVVLWMFEFSTVQSMLSSAKFLLWISMDDGTFIFVLLFVGIKVETDDGINESYVPIWIFGKHFVLCALWRFKFGAILVKFFLGKVSTENSNGRCDIDSSPRLFCHSSGSL